MGCVPRRSPGRGPPARGAEVQGAGEEDGDCHVSFARALVIAAVAVGCAAPVPNPSSTTDKLLPLRHAVRDGIVDARVGSIDKLAVDSGYRYIGGQRFILQNTADAEQHIFADVDSAGEIRRL